MRHFGIKNIIIDEHEGEKKSNREKGAYAKVMAGVMMMVSGGERVEDVEVLRADQGLLETLGWDEMVCADTMLNFIGDRRRNAKNRRVNDALVIKVLNVYRQPKGQRGIFLSGRETIQRVDGDDCGMRGDQSGRLSTRE